MLVLVSALGIVAGLVLPVVSFVHLFNVVSSPPWTS